MIDVRGAVSVTERVALVKGAVRIALEGGVPLDLDEVAARAVVLYADRLTWSSEQMLADLRPFLHDRVRCVLGLAGYAYDEIEAVLAVGRGSLPDLNAPVDVLHRVRDDANFLTVVLAAKRIVNILGCSRGATRRTVLHATSRARSLRGFPGAALRGRGSRGVGRLRALPAAHRSRRCWTASSWMSWSWTPICG